MKKVLFLGAAAPQIPPIQYAIDQGYYVITCDYLPSNPGHLLAHESYDVSTTDMEAVLELSRRLDIDGIVAYASDPAAPTAAYVAEKLRLPGNPYASVEVLARKDKFRDFLASHGFNSPRSKSFRRVEDARKWLPQLEFPVFVKAVDSSGNKGMSCLTHANELDAAFDYALSFSRAGKVVVEEKIPGIGYQIDSDAFMVEGELRFWQWADAHFDTACTPPFPIANSLPSTLAPAVGRHAARELERMLKILGFRAGAFNVEFMVGPRNEIWFLEVGPRNGGDCIPDTLKLATGIDLVRYTVEAALGHECSDLVNAPPQGYWTNYVVHSLQSGRLKEIRYSEFIRQRIVREMTWVRPGDPIAVAKGSNNTLGVLILEFRTHDEMLETLADMNSHVCVDVAETPSNMRKAS
ncbi:ATP-grasp domain-containing protein [Halomonas mongoliensis]|uniref:ATP-grasp domain-containing protein n=1 Tax=Halomonas mongoliensis TaxID=321265 RepID=UPI00403AD91C